MNGRSERGSATVELMILAPVFVLLLGFVVAVGRTQSTRADVEGVAHSAARSITLSRDVDAAVGRARRAAAASVRESSPTCRSMGWAAQITPARVTVTISCTVDLSAAALLPLPGSYRVEGRAVEVFDRYREAP